MWLTKQTSTTALPLPVCMFSGSQARCICVALWSGVCLWKGTKASALLWRWQHPCGSRLVWGKPSLPCGDSAAASSAGIEWVGEGGMNQRSSQRTDSHIIQSDTGNRTHYYSHSHMNQSNTANRSDYHKHVLRIDVLSVLVCDLSWRRSLLHRSVYFCVHSLF